jgi:hypothetical protein
MLTWWTVYNEQKNQRRTMAIMFPGSECIWFHLWWNMNQKVYINNIHFTNHILECYSRNHRLWPSICRRISYTSVKCAWMLEDNISDNSFNIRKAKWLYQIHPSSTDGIFNQIRVVAHWSCIRKTPPNSRYLAPRTGGNKASSEGKNSLSLSLPPSVCGCMCVWRGGGA